MSVTQLAPAHSSLPHNRIVRTIDCTETLSEWESIYDTDDEYKF